MKTPSAQSLAVAVIHKYQFILDAGCYRDAAAIMGKALAPDVLAYLVALNGCRIASLTPDIVEWLNGLASAIVCAEVPAIEAAA